MNMQKISDNGATAAAKAYIALPLMVCVVIFAFTILDLVAGRGNALAPMAVLAVGGGVVLLWKIFIFSLADEVIDAEDSLKIRKGKHVGVFELSKIDKIEEKPFSRPSKACVIFLENGTFGHAIDFVPIGSGTGLASRSKLLADLNMRIELSKRALAHESSELGGMNDNGRKFSAEGRNSQGLAVIDRQLAP